MITVNEIFIEYHERLNTMYEPGELEQITIRAFEHCCNFSRADIVLKKNEYLSLNSFTQLKKILDQLEVGRPIQHILGYSWFLDNKFNVSSDVLIPRPETEELVKWILNDFRNLSKIKLNVLDICTGSGCIPISLSLNCPDWVVSACDISENALSVASENNDILEAGVNFFKADILKWNKENVLKEFIKNLYGSFNSLDLITSNPPYVLEKEKHSMHERVLVHEPSIALFVPDNDPLIFYREIADFAYSSLTSGGKLIVEINREYANAVMDLFKQKKFSDIILKNDIIDNPRMISASLNY